jgi:hypothetical protein
MVMGASFSEWVGTNRKGRPSWAALKS